MEEFFRQGDAERDLQLPISFLCDRHSVCVPDSQKGVCVSVRACCYMCVFLLCEGVCNIHFKSLACV